MSQSSGITTTRSRLANEARRPPQPGHEHWVSVYSESFLGNPSGYQNWKSEAPVFSLVLKYDTWASCDQWIACTEVEA